MRSVHQLSLLTGVADPFIVELESLSEPAFGRAQSRSTKSTAVLVDQLMAEHSSQENSGAAAIQVTAGRQAEGGPDIALQLALDAADRGLRVVLVDSALDEPSLHLAFSLDNSVGLSSVLDGPWELDAAVHRCSGRSLVVLPAGPAVPVSSDPERRRRRFVCVLRALTTDADLVIVLVPSVLDGGVAIDDAGEVFHQTIVTVVAGISTRRDVAAVTRQLESASGGLLPVLVKVSSRGPEPIVDDTQQARVALPEADDSPPSVIESDSHTDGHVKRSTLAVLANTAATGVLGIAFWIAAAAIYPEDVVAVSVAAASLLIAVSFLAQLNLATGLSRFMPGARGTQKWVLSSAYRISLGLAIGAAFGIVAIGAARGGSIITGGDFSLTLVLAISIPVWVVFALQDGALVSLRKAHWLPIENGLTTVAKLALLPALAMLATDAVILIAWTLPAIPAILIVNRALYRSLLDPGHERGTSPWPMVRYSTGDLVGAAATVLSLRFVPLLVVELIDGVEAAHIVLPWSILTVAALALTAISRLMLSEMSHDPERAGVVAQRSARFVMLLFVPGSLVGAALATPMLSLAGSQYAASGTIVLAGGLLGLIPAALIESRFAAMRFEGRVLAVSVRQGLRATLLLSLSIAALLTDSAELIGLAFLVANTFTLLSVPRLARTLSPGSRNVDVV